jgi:hypothetical protein
MDFTYLVHTVIGRVLRSPALHYAGLGALLFAAVAARGPVSPAVRLVIPATRVEAAVQEYAQLRGHPLTPEERQRVLRAVVDEEILYAYARRLGLDKEPVVEQRLSQIATFVAENPHAAKSPKELADEALLLGLNDGDLVVHRILIERIPARVAALDEVRNDVRARVRATLADAWLTTRLAQLRAEFQVEVQDTQSQGGRS